MSDLVICVLEVMRRFEMELSRAADDLIKSDSRRFVGLEALSPVFLFKGVKLTSN